MPCRHCCHSTRTPATALHCRPPRAAVTPVTPRYNDEPEPVGPNTAHYGHTKGVLGANAAGGMWLLHSTPRFPATSLPAGQAFYFPEVSLLPRGGRVCVCACVCVCVCVRV